MVPRSFKLLSSAALVLAAASIALSAVLFTRVDAQQAATNQSRVDITFRSCREQNKRHDRTLTKLDKLIAALPDPVERKRAKANIAGTKGLIETLAPHQDCKALVKRRFGSTRPN